MKELEGQGEFIKGKLERNPLQMAQVPKDENEKEKNLFLCLQTENLQKY
jgi:hypothetical protein